METYKDRYLNTCKVFMHKLDFVYHFLPNNITFLFLLFNITVYHEQANLYSKFLKINKDK